MTEKMLLTAILLHLFLCLILIILIKCDVFKISSQLIPLALFVPFWGGIMLLCAEYMTRSGKNGTKELQVDDLKLDEQDFRGLNLSQDDRLSSVVPLEEAMVINNSKTRRQFMIDIIGEDAGQYTDLLKRAKYNDDIEVIHYASAAIMEIQRTYELNLQKKEAAVNQNPQDTEALDSYIQTLKNYINSGLVEENFLNIQRSRYQKALSKRMALPDADRDLYYDAADNYIELNDIPSAEGILKNAKKKWPGDEKIWLLSLKICHLSKNKKKRDELIASLSKSHRFFSEEAREAIRFWSR